MDKRFGPKISVYWSKSHKHNLSKADTCLKRTKILVPKVSALDRFHCTLVYLMSFYLYRYDILKNKISFAKMQKFQEPFMPLLFVFKLVNVKLICVSWENKTVFLSIKTSIQTRRKQKKLTQVAVYVWSLWIYSNRSFLFENDKFQGKLRI